MTTQHIATDNIKADMEIEILALRAENEKLRAALQRPRVKPLEWVEVFPNEFVSFPYKIRKIEGMWLVYGIDFSREINGMKELHFATIADAKDAANTHHTSRIYEALEDTK